MQSYFKFILFGNFIVTLYHIFRLNMKKRNTSNSYFGIWSIMTVALAVFIGLSIYEPVTICGIELRTISMVDKLTKTPEPTPEEVAEAKRIEEEVKKKAEMPKYDLSTPQTFLFIGDSMLEGLYPRLAAYAKENGHKLYVVIWWGSTSEKWGNSDKLKKYVEKYQPTYVFICLGANELFVKDIKEKRKDYVTNMISQIGDRPYLWIGPPNWKPDTGINELIDENTPEGYFFLTNGMTFDRKKDGAHPTQKSSELWMDSVLRWMKKDGANPIINMEVPQEQTARATRVEVLYPNSK